MIRVSKTALLIGVAVLAGATFAGAAYAQATANNNSGANQSTPRDWNYEIRGRQARPEGQSRDQCRRQLARGNPPGPVRDDQGKDGRRRV